MDLLDPINVSSMTVLPKEAYVAWIREILSAEEHTSEDLMEDDHNTYLIAETEDTEGLWEYLNDNYEAIFENELSSWTTDVSVWPELSLENFKNFFQIVFSSMVFDLEEDLD